MLPNIPSRLYYAMMLVALTAFLGGVLIGFLLGWLSA